MTSVQSVFKNPTHHALTRNIRVLRKIIRVIREIRVQEPYASRNNKEFRVLRKIIRVIRAIRVQKPYAPRYDIVLRVPG